MSIVTADIVAVVTVLSWLLNLVQYRVNQRAARAKEMADRAREVAERERIAIEAERRAEADRSSDILQQRKELAAENARLRDWQGTENQRLKNLLAESRSETDLWRRQASEWQERYERETANNVALHAQVDDLLARINRMEGGAAAPARRARRSTTTAAPDTD